MFVFYLTRCTVSNNNFSILLFSQIPNKQLNKIRISLFLFESQNHRIVGVGRDLCGHPVQPSC